MHEQSGGATRKYEERSDAERKQRLYVEGMNETREGAKEEQKGQPPQEREKEKKRKSKE